ncbi:hypothetical protein V6N12_038307 [Hibiscus sabdariffa]|uniref:Uncharacterized protein n=1 Tax=Hibiscus sabdariffa TaxID=183260 RepID=A0ABR2BEJ7_9ROSI
MHAAEHWKERLVVPKGWYVGLEIPSSLVFLFIKAFQRALKRRQRNPFLFISPLSRPSQRRVRPLLIASPSRHPTFSLLFAQSSTDSIITWEMGVKDWAFWLGLGTDRAWV